MSPSSVAALAVSLQQHGCAILIQGRLSLSSKRSPSVPVPAGAQAVWFSPKLPPVISLALAMCSPVFLQL